MSEAVNQKIEGHMTLYLESKQQVSKSQDKNQKMECHTTPHLTRKLQLSPQMEVR